MSRIYGERTDHLVEKLTDSIYRINEFYTANCYLIIGSEKALLIDCGVGLGDLRGVVKSLTPLPIILVATHAHVDHIGGLTQFDKLYVHEQDICKFNKLQTSKFIRKGFVITSAANSFFKKYSPSVKDVKFGGHKTEWIGINDGYEFDLGDRIIKVKHLPGHSLGSIALIDEKEKYLFIGDNISPATWLFVPHHSTVEDWLPSAYWIKEMSKDYKIYWGHIEGVITDELIDNAIKYGEIVFKKKNSLISTIKAYPKFDQFGSCFIYTTGKIHNKK